MSSDAPKVVVPASNGDSGLQEPFPSPMVAANPVRRRFRPQPIPKRPALAVIGVVLRVWAVLHVLAALIALLILVTVLILGAAQGPEGLLLASPFTMLIGPAIGLLLSSVLLVGTAELIDVFVSQERLLIEIVNELRRRD